MHEVDLSAFRQSLRNLQFAYLTLHMLECIHHPKMRVCINQNKKCIQAKHTPDQKLYL